MSTTSAPTGRNGDPSSARLSEPVDHVSRPRSTETKASFKTTEFVAMVVVIVGILISAASISGSGSHKDIFDASHAWLYVAIVATGYMISRGLAKSGSRERYDERS